MTDLLDTAWGAVRLGDVCTFENGDRGKNYPGKKSVTASGIPFINAGHISRGKIDWEGLDHIPEAHFDHLVPGTVRKGDFLFCLRGSLGKFGFVDRETLGAIASSLVIIRHGAEILDVWLGYYFISQIAADMIEKTAGGAAQPNLSPASVKSFEIPLPPLEEQRRIVALLDQAFAALDRARAHAEANLADAEELCENSLRLTFADLLALWGALPFDEACQTITPTEKIKQRDYLAEGDFPIAAQGAEFVAGYWNEYTAVTETGGSIVIFGDHTRHLKHVDFTFVAGADGTKIVKPADGLRSDYVYFALRSQPIEVTGYARHFKFLKEKVIPELPILDQETLCRSLWEIEGKCRRLQENYEDKLTDIANLRQSLLQKAFSGQLTARQRPKPIPVPIASTPSCVRPGGAWWRARRSGAR